MNNYKLDYDTYTWNNITKLVDPYLLLNEALNPIEEQWHSFQLEHMAEHLNIEIFNVFNMKLPLPIIIQKLKNSNKNRESSCLKCDALGLNPNKIKNEFDYNNMGGILTNKLILNPSKTDYEFEKEILYNNSGKHPIKIEINNSLVQKEVEYKIKQLGNQTKVKTDKTKINIQIGKSRRQIKGEKTIKLAINDWDRLGKLDWQLNSCFMDSIIYLLLFPNNTQNINPFIENILTTEPNQQDILHSYPDTDITKYLLNLNKLKKELIDIKESIKNGNIVTLAKFSANLQALFSDNLKNTYYDGDIYDLSEFFVNLLDILIVNYYEFSNENIYFLNETDDIDFNSLYPIKVDIPEVIIKNKQTLSANPELVYFKIYGNLLKYLITKNNYIKDISDLDISKLYFCNQCNEFILPEKKIEHIDFHTSNLTTTQQLVYSSIQIDENYWQTKDDWNAIEQGSSMFFYKHGQKNNPELWLSQDKIDDSVAILIKQQIIEQTINNAKMIMFYMNRLELRTNKKSGKIENNFITYRLIPNEEIVDLDNNHYKLTGITVFIPSATHYHSFVLYNNTWLEYNDNFNIDHVSDYLIRVGTYNDLLKYKKYIIQHYGSLYIYERIQS